MKMEEVSNHKSKNKRSLSHMDRHHEKEKEREGRWREKVRERDWEKEREHIHVDDCVKIPERKRRKIRDDYEDHRVTLVERKSREEDDLTEKSRKFDDEMEKRRRRVQEWQKLKKIKEGLSLNEVKSGKNWSLDDEKSDDEEKTDMNVDDQDGMGEIIDPLDAFMMSLEVNNSSNSKTVMGRFIPGEDSNSDNDDDEEKSLNDEEYGEEFMKTKAENLSIVDHSKITYPWFRKNFYREVNEISRMSQDEVCAYRKHLELKIHGKNVPKPVKTWNQTGLSTKILERIKKLKFVNPTQIQAQALPVIMSGRDCISIAKTGSGKTLAFVLPMLRHIKAQPELKPGDGPIGLIMAPTRELVQQIYRDIKRFSKVVGIRCVAVYGGSNVAQQISELKRGVEIIVCTPGRMIDVLGTSGGNITNLTRVTYLVFDEADRMFDMGFEPQITKIIQSTRPDRQTVLFSATFPRQVEILARKVLDRPIEIQVGRKNVVNKDITQLIEVRQENDKFYRLLELLGDWYEKGKILIFVKTQAKCDSLLKDMFNYGYHCLSLHGAKDQMDRESTIADFKSNACNVLIATSIASRGLDVKELELVINFDPPNHYEEYVHRVGRTGRAGRKGCAITFISEEEARYAPDLVKALELSEQVVPDDLKALSDHFTMKVNQGMEKYHGSGYGGSGFKFNQEEEDLMKAVKKAQAKEYGLEEYESDGEDDEVGPGDPSPKQTVGPTEQAIMNLRNNLAKIQAEHYETELEINDFPQNARWRITHKETIGPISEWTGAAIMTRGQYCPQGKVPRGGDRKLYLFIEGPTEQSVKRAKAELRRVLEDNVM